MQRAYRISPADRGLPRHSAGPVGSGLNAISRACASFAVCLIVGLAQPAKASEEDRIKQFIAICTDATTLDATAIADPLETEGWRYVETRQHAARLSKSIGEAFAISGLAYGSAPEEMTSIAAEFLQDDGTRSQALVDKLHQKDGHVMWHPQIKRSLATIVPDQNTGELFCEIAIPTRLSVGGFAYQMRLIAQVGGDRKGIGSSTVTYDGIEVLDEYVMDVNISDHTVSGDKTLIKGSKGTALITQVVPRKSLWSKLNPAFGIRSLLRVQFRPKGT